MTFAEILDEALALLQRHGRVTYQTFQLQFQLDEAHLAALKDQLLYAHPQVMDDGGRGLLWTAERPGPEPEVQHGAGAESRFHELILVVIGLLQRERRITYRRLKHIFRLDDVFLEDVRKELTFQQVARDEQGEGLVWTGEAQSVTPPTVAVPSQAVTADPMGVRSPAPPILRLPVTETRTPFHGPTGAAEVNVTGVLQDEPVVTPKSIRTAPEAERRQLTVMFCDLADSTKLSQQLDPEDLREVIRAYQTTAAEVIHQYEGHIAQYLGDGLLIYFGWPKAHEDDAPRALHAGLGIVEAITTNLNPRLEAEKEVQLTIRLGIHTGPVVVGVMGGGGRHENLATGETVNVAARLEGLAAPNTVVISNVTARLVQDTFTLEALRSHTLKGVAEPMPVFRVLGLLDVYASSEEIVSVGIPFLVGRDEEVGLLRRRWEQAKGGLGQVVLISGEAGIGKSSLVGNLRDQVREENLPWIAFRCSPYHQNSALYPVIEHVQRVCHFHQDDTLETRLDKLEQTLQAYGFELEEVVPLLATLLSVPFTERYLPLALSPQQQKQQTQDTLVAWLLEEAERQSVVAVWEDLHWADPSTLELLGFLIEQAPTAAMLHVLTFRPEFTPPWLSRSHITPMTLNRLERPQVEAMITHLTGGKTLPAEVVEHIITKTDGVPLWV